MGYTQLKVSISQDIAHKTTQCKRCATPITIMADEVQPEYCPKCEREIDIEKRKQKVRSKGLPIISCTCGKDLSGRANSDGRAEELSGIVRYFCKKCIQSQKAGDEAGKRIDDYEVIKTIGHGGMGNGKCGIM